MLLSGTSEVLLMQKMLQVPAWRYVRAIIICMVSALHLVVKGQAPVHKAKTRAGGFITKSVTSVTNTKSLPTQQWFL